MSCADTSQSTSEDSSPEGLFTLLPAEKTHVDFQNVIDEGLNTNVLMYEYFYNGGGVAVGDVNGDGYDDLYFTSNMNENKLYLNKTQMEFQDITAQAGVAGRQGPGRLALRWWILMAMASLTFMYVIRAIFVQKRKPTSFLSIKEMMLTVFQHFRRRRQDMA
jgi:hypothetical protein